MQREVNLIGASQHEEILALEECLALLESLVSHCSPSLRRPLSQISLRLKSPQYAAGIAMARIDCEQSSCKTACGLN